MTAELSISADLPRTDGLPPLRTGALRAMRRPGRWLMRAWWRIRARGQHHVPTSGPVILAANHIGAIDGVVLIAATRRLTFCLAKHELFVGRLGQLFDIFGQIPVRRREIDTLAIRRSVQVLRAGRILAVFPEGVRTDGKVSRAHGGAAYLALVTGAPIVPVALLGTRPRGGGKNSLPPRRSRMEIVYGEPIHVPRTDWPRRKAVVAEWTEVVRTRLAEHVRSAVELTGTQLPGPVAPTSHVADAIGRSQSTTRKVDS